MYLLINLFSVLQSPIARPIDATFHYFQLQRLNIDPVKWNHITFNFESTFKGIVGESLSIINSIKNFDRKRALNISNCFHYFSKSSI